MSMQHDEELRELFRKGVDPLVSSTGFEPRLRSRLREHAGRRPHRAPQVVFSAAVSLALVAALVAGFLVTRGSGTRTAPTNGVVEALTAGAAASAVPDPTGNFVWLTSTVWTNPSPIATSPCPISVVGPKPTPTFVSCSGDLQTETVEVDVIDWTGAVRHQFSLPEVQLGSMGQHVAASLLAISPDGTRALLGNGEVIDQTGHVVDTLTPLGALLTAAAEPLGGGPVGVRWLSNDSGLCVAGPSPLLADPVAGASLLNSDEPGSYTSVSLEVVPLAGPARTVSTIGVADTPDTRVYVNVVNGCDAATDVMSITHFEGSLGGGGLPGELSAWSVQLSSGRVLYQQPPVQADEGSPWSTGSEAGNLVLEYLWNSEVAGTCTDTVVRLPAGTTVPITDARDGVCESTWLNGDGTRILRTEHLAHGGGTDIQLIDASTATVVRSIHVPAGDSFGVSALPSPSGGWLMVQVNVLSDNGVRSTSYWLVVDSKGGITELDAPDEASAPFAFAGVPPAPAQS